MIETTVFHADYPTVVGGYDGERYHYATADDPDQVRALARDFRAGAMSGELEPFQNADHAEEWVSNFEAAWALGFDLVYLRRALVVQLCAVRADYKARRVFDAAVLLGETAVNLNITLPRPRVFNNFEDVDTYCLFLRLSGLRGLPLYHVLVAMNEQQAQLVSANTDIGRAYGLAHAWNALALEAAFWDQ